MNFFETFSHLFHPRRSNNHRPRILHPEGFLFLSLAAFVFFFAVATAPIFVQPGDGNVLGFASNITASDVVTRTNEQRAQAGLPALTVNAQLNQAALAKAQNMFQLQYWAHVAPDGTTPWKFFKQARYNYSVAGENLARDFSNSGDMMSAWMASPTHRANIVSPRYKEIGVAVVDGNLLGTDTTLVVQLFGSQGGAAKPQISDAGNTQKAPAKAAPQVKGDTEQPAPTPAVSPVPTQGEQPTQPAATPAPITEQTEKLEFEQLQPVKFTQNGENAEVLAGSIFNLGTLKTPPLFSPTQLMKAFFLAIIFIVIMTLMYDTLIMANKNTVRLVGKNFAHILFLGVVAFLLLFFKSGMVG